MRPYHRAALGLGIAVIGCFAPFMKLSAEAAKKAKDGEQIAEVNYQTDKSERIALQRAKRCLPLIPEKPITDGTIVYYDRAQTRLIATGRTVCDRAGNTAVVGEGGEVFDIRSAPQESINEILDSRQGVKPDGDSNTREGTRNATQTTKRRADEKR